MEERSKFLFNNKLCHGCLKTVTKEHNAKTCSSGRSCKVCNEKRDNPPWLSQQGFIQAVLLMSAFERKLSF